MFDKFKPRIGQNFNKKDKIGEILNIRRLEIKKSQVDRIETVVQRVRNE